MSYDCVIGDADTRGAAAAAPVHWDRIRVCVCAGFAVPRVSSMPSPRILCSVCMYVIEQIRNLSLPLVLRLVSVLYH